MLDMNANSEEGNVGKFLKKRIINICPYCGQNYNFPIEVQLKKSGLTTSLIKPHEGCNKFLIFIDPNGAVRGTQCIDSEVGDGSNGGDELDMEIYVKLFEDQDNISEFYHIIEMDGKHLKNKGIITTKKVKYHSFLRSEFYKEWIKHFYEEKEEFAFIFIDDVIIITINLYDMVIFTLGIHIAQFDFNVELEGIGSVIDYIKGKAVSLGEKILS